MIKVNRLLLVIAFIGNCSFYTLEVMGMEKIPPVQESAVQKWIKDNKNDLDKNKYKHKDPGIKIDDTIIKQIWQELIVGYKNIDKSWFDSQNKDSKGKPRLFYEHIWSRHFFPFFVSNKDNHNKNKVDNDGFTVESKGNKREKVFWIPVSIDVINDVYKEYKDSKDEHNKEIIKRIQRKIQSNSEFYISLEQDILMGTIMDCLKGNIIPDFIEVYSKPKFEKKDEITFACDFKVSTLFKDNIKKNKQATDALNTNNYILRFVIQYKPNSDNEQFRLATAFFDNRKKK